MTRQPTCPESPVHYLTEGKVPTGYCAWRFAENVGSTRGILRDSRGQLLVVDASANSVTLLFDDDGDDYSSASERLVIAQAPGLNHGIAIYGGYLFASSDTTVYRWPYDGARKDLGTPQTVVTGMPASGDHSTRTLAFDGFGNLPSPPGIGSGKQWAYFKGDASDGTHTDDWCRDSSNVVAPVLAMQAHSAPLDLLFYAGGSFPDAVVGHLFVTFHGSWDRTPATGYKVVRIPVDTNGMPSGPPEDLLTAADPSRPDSWGHRPVGLAQGIRGELYVTSDESHIVIAIGHNGT